MTHNSDDGWDSDEQLFISKLPKVELHAHLSGSLSDETTSCLLEQRSKSDHKDMKCALTLGNQRTLEECFEIFKIIHLLMDNIETVKMITCNVIKEFNKDNVRYIEIRTTPKSVQGAYSKQEYLEAVLQSVKNSENLLDIVVRVMISIDRGRGVIDGWDTLKLTMELLKHEQYGKYICGIDVSGNPKVGSLKEYLPLLKEARMMGLKIAVHLLEINTETAFDEASAIINEGLVDRIGHATFLHPVSGGSESLTNLVKEKRIPLEMCISSNLKCNSVSSLEKHHAKLWIDEDHPISICTDDKGVFSTTLTKELLMFKKLMSGKLDARNLTLTSLSSSFLRDDEKQRLIERVKEEMSDIF